MRNLCEEMAITFGSRSATVRKALSQARACLANDLQKGFGKGRYDKEAKTLRGMNGVVLQWQVRLHPDQPISYENQQTSVGVVIAKGRLKT
jgi:hypothetical protein